MTICVHNVVVCQNCVRYSSFAPGFWITFVLGVGVGGGGSVAKRQWVFFRAKVVFVCGYTYGPVT